MLKRFALSALLLAAWTASAAAAEPRQCLSADERRVAITAHKVVSLARAMRAVKARYPGDVIRARLCQQGPRLVYVLTVLPRNGKVVHAAVDAATGVLGGGS
jgi:uncharacterized membrane protein YkoI